MDVTQTPKSSTFDIIAPGEAPSNILIDINSAAYSQQLELTEWLAEQNSAAVAAANAFKAQIQNSIDQTSKGFQDTLKETVSEAVETAKPDLPSWALPAAFILAAMFMMRGSK